MELLLGAGTSRVKKICLDGRKEWSELVTLDNAPEYKPDILWNLAFQPELPFPDDHFDEIHAYEVLEHLGVQGDWPTLARQFSDYWRILKPGGLFCATVPCWKSLWALGDPDHKRVINEGTLTFLQQPSYGERGAGMTPMTDYHRCYAADFEVVRQFHQIGAKSDDQFSLHDVCNFVFVLKAIKPARGTS